MCAKQSGSFGIIRPISAIPGTTGKLFPFSSLVPSRRALEKSFGKSASDISTLEARFIFRAKRHLYSSINRLRKKGTKKFDSIFQGQKARALHEIYERRQDWLGVKDLADASGVSPATASETLTELDRREWVDVQGAGPSKQRRLRAARPLPESWPSYATLYNAPTVRRSSFSKGDAP